MFLTLDPALKHTAGAGDESLHLNCGEAQRTQGFGSFGNTPRVCAWGESSLYLKSSHPGSFY